ncbi:MAG TPA: spore coat protein U domain-containing protein [Nitrospirota bacterium]
MPHAGKVPVGIADKLNTRRSEETGRAAKEEEGMKKTLVAVIAVAVVAMAGAAIAADTTTVAVSATVVGACKFNSGGSVAFGNLDPSLAPGTVTGTVVKPQFWCTKNAAYTISDDTGLHKLGTIFRMQSAVVATDFLPYTFSYTATGTGAGKSSPVDLTINAQVDLNDTLNIAALGYSDTVTLTISP